MKNHEIAELINKCHDEIMAIIRAVEADRVQKVSSDESALILTEGLSRVDGGRIRTILHDNFVPVIKQLDVVRGRKKQLERNNDEKNPHKQ